MGALLQSTIVPKIYFDSSDVPGMRKDLTVELWEYGVKLGLQNLYSIPPTATSRVVLEHVSGSGKKVVIVPSVRPGRDGANTMTEPVDRVDWPRSQNFPGATPKDLPPLSCANNSIRQSSGIPIRGQSPGTGAGSDVSIEFTSQDYLSTQSLPGGMPDEVLLHELVHALRMQKAMLLCTWMDRDFDAKEEFFAIMITNIYSSECGRPLRANHNGKTLLSRDLSDEKAYVKAYEPEIKALRSEMGAFCAALGAINTKFNPLRVAI